MESAQSPPFGSKRKVSYAGTMSPMMPTFPRTSVSRISPTLRLKAGSEWPEASHRALPRCAEPFGAFAKSATSFASAVGEAAWVTRMIASSCSICRPARREAYGMKSRSKGRAAMAARPWLRRSSAFAAGGTYQSTSGSRASNGACAHEPTRR